MFQKLTTSINQVFQNMSMRKKMLISFLAVSFLPLLTTVYIIYHHAESELEKELGSYTVEITKQVNSRLNAYLEETGRISDIIRYNTSIQEFLSIQRYSSNAEDVETIMDARKLIDSVGQIYLGIKGIFIMNDYGRVISSSTDKTVELDYPFKKQPWFQKENAQLSQIQLYYHNQSYVSNKPVVSYTSRITDSNFAVRGDLLIDFSPDIITGFSEEIRLGKHGIVFMVDQQGDFVVPDSRVSPSLKNQLFPMLKTDPPREDHFDFQYEGVKYLVGYYPSSKTGWTIIGVVPFREISTGIQEIQTILWIMGAISLLVILALSTSLSKTITSPLLKLERSMKHVGTGNVKFRLHVNRDDEIGRLSNRFNIMLQELDELTERVYKSRSREIQLELMNKITELNALHAQINPHFLYNTLNTMTCIGEIHAIEDVSIMSRSLASMFKYSINADPITTFEDELTHVMHFMTIMRLRYTSRLHLQTDISEEWLDEPMMKLILQPIVENAVIHGLEPKQAEGTIRIKLDYIEEWLVLSVSDDGIGMSSSQLEQINDYLNQDHTEKTLETHIGLRNVQRRLNIYYNQQASIRIQSEPGKGTIVEIKWYRG
ncbi:sensor histidine kinase [Paenibacillus sp. HB172176]|uniref:sensor histidine kinase n=1 Tax=Paenibacillus sp. HB172176 TaxID=2493690 RepID=UPI00143A7BF0|nr:sensor histidine kinase [Paenibacillus sp. HB172176]